MSFLSNFFLIVLEILLMFIFSFTHCILESTSTNLVEGEYQKPAAIGSNSIIIVF